MDEPTTGVDPVSRREFWDILVDLHIRGVTILVSTPYMDEAERCLRVGLMYGGELIECDTPKNLKKQVAGDLLEIRPVADGERGIGLLRRSRQWRECWKCKPSAIFNVFKEVALYGTQIHVVTKKDTTAASQKPVIEQALSANITVETVDRIVPSLEDVFITNMKW